MGLLGFSPLWVSEIYIFPGGFQASRNAETPPPPPEREGEGEEGWGGIEGL